jgi:redox-sensing transcriptional repressor
MAATQVPDIVIGRLPIYLRALNLLAEAGHEFTSSQELGGNWGLVQHKFGRPSHFTIGKQGWL